MSFAVSLLLLAWVSLRWARHLCDTPADRYWIFVGTALLQVGAITGLSSLAHQLTPAGWLVMQVLAKCISPVQRRPCAIRTSTVSTCLPAKSL